MVLDSLGKLNKELNIDRKEKYENEFEIVVNKKQILRLTKRNYLRKISLQVSTSTKQPTILSVKSLELGDIKNY